MSTQTSTQIQPLVPTTCLTRPTSSSCITTSSIFLKHRTDYVQAKTSPSSLVLTGETPAHKAGHTVPPGRPVPPPSLTLLSSPDEPFIHVQDSVLVLLCSRLQYIHFLFLENATLTLKNPAQMPFFSKLSHFLPLGSHASSFIPRI